MRIVRKLGHFLTALIVSGFCFLAVFYVMGSGARRVQAIWLPFALIAVIGVLVGFARESTSRVLSWFAISCGVALMWMISEPETSLRAHPRLMPIAIVLAVGCLVGLLWLVLRWTSSKSLSYGWAVALVMMSWLIAFFSSPSGGSGGMIAAAIEMLGLSPGRAEFAVLVVRKCIHFTFYGLLGWTAFRWVLSSGSELRKAIWCGVLMALSFASFDEGRQTFFVDRTGSAWDVLLDCAGAAVFVWLGFAKVKQRREQARALPN